MKEILIIANGVFAEHFLAQIFKIKNIIRKYIIITSIRSEICEKLEKNENFELLYFDATSIEKLRLVVNSHEFDRAIIINIDKFETEISIKNLREILPNIDIYAADFWGINKNYKDEKGVKIVNALAIFSSRLVGFLPDSPVFADNVGIGKGEIMEVKVPFGSSFAYKKIRFLTNEKYSIPIIYRQNRYIITTPNTAILPNDSILTVGEPSTLRAVFAMIKKQNGQFPLPFGANIVAFIDMKISNAQIVLNIAKTAVYLHNKLQNTKLYIKILNPILGDVLDEIKSYEKIENTEIILDYSNIKISDFSVEVANFKSGLIITSPKIFENYKNLLYKSSTPILTTGDGDFNDVCKSVVINGGENISEESSVVFDVSSQLNLDIFLYYFGDENSKENKILDNYKELSKLFKQNLFIIDENEKNPILALENERDFLQFIPFNEKILSTNLTAPFKRDVDLVYYKLKKGYQLFIPVDYEYEI